MPTVTQWPFQSPRSRSQNITKYCMSDTCDVGAFLARVRLSSLSLINLERNIDVMNGLTRWQRPELSVWPGFGRLTDLRDEIDRLFEAPLSQLARGSHLLSGWSPALDIYEDKD